MIGDKDKRAKFDAGEIDAVGQSARVSIRALTRRQGGFRGNPFGGAAPGGGDRDFHFTWGQGGEEQPGFSAEDIFAEILGGGGARRGGGRATAPGQGRGFPGRE